MNAKETLEKIANALNIAKGEEKKEETAKVEETVEATEVVEAVETKAEDTVVEAVEEKTEEVEETKEVKATEEVKEEVSAEVKEEPVIEETKEDPRVAKMQEQIDELQKMLEQAVKEDSEEAAPEVEVKPLTHSPESKPDTSHKKIGGHGGDVMSRVYKYLS